MPQKLSFVNLPLRFLRVISRALLRLRFQELTNLFVLLLRLLQCINTFVLWKSFSKESSRFISMKNYSCSVPSVKSQVSMSHLCYHVDTGLLLSQSLLIYSTHSKQVAVTHFYIIQQNIILMSNCKCVTQGS